MTIKIPSHSLRLIGFIFYSFFHFFNSYGQNISNIQTNNEIAQSNAIEAQIKDIMTKLTLEEKVSLVHAQSKFSTKGVERLGIPELWMSDGPHGVRAEISWDDWSYAG